MHKLILHAWHKLSDRLISPRIKRPKRARMGKQINFRQKIRPRERVDQTRAARARSAPPRSSTTDLVLRAVLTKTRAMKCTPIGVQICELQDFDDFDENNYATRISTV